MRTDPTTPVDRSARRWLVLGSCCLSLLIVSMDATIVNVALPSIRASFGGDVSRLQWVIDAYTIAIAAFLITSGATADRLGRRRVFQTGLALFSLSSLACSLAPNVGVLIGARVVQGLSGSMLNPVAMSIITNTFPDRRERARAIGVWGAVVGVSMAVGPIVGGLLTEYVGWRSVFWVNVPIGVVAIVLTALFVPESKAPQPRRTDPVGQVLLVVVLTCLSSALIEAPGRGWGSPVILGLFAVVAVALVAVVGYELRVEQPLIDPRFFRSIPFSAAALTAAVAFAAQGAFLFATAIYLQDARGLSPAAAGVRMVPVAGAMLVASVVSGRVVGRFGTRPSLLLTGAMLAASGLSLTGLSADTPYAAIAVSYLLFGLGLGTVNAPITTTAVSGMPLAQAGVAAAVASTSRQTGVTLGVAVTGTITGVATASHLGPGFAQQTHPLWWATAAAGVVIAAMGLASTSAYAKASTERVRGLFSPAA